MIDDEMKFLLQHNHKNVIDLDDYSYDNNGKITASYIKTKDKFRIVYVQHGRYTKLKRKITISNHYLKKSFFLLIKKAKNKSMPRKVIIIINV